MFRAIKRLFIWMGLMAEKATETDAINQAVVERGIRDSKAKADKAHYANGQLASQIALLKDQIKRQERQRQDQEHCDHRKLFHRITIALSRPHRPNRGIVSK